MKQKLYECSKCKNLNDTRRYCRNCGVHHEMLKEVDVYTQEDIEREFGKKKRHHNTFKPQTL